MSATFVPVKQGQPQSAGLAYRKSRKHVQRTVKALDYEEIYLALPNKLPHLEELLGHIDGFLAVPQARAR
jgi:hypothetical protein